MAQCLKLLPVIVLFAIFHPIVCSTYKMYGDRHNRASYINKRATHYKEESTKQKHKTPKNNEQETKGSIVDQNIRSTFSTNFGPGLFLFNNTVPLVNQTHFSSYNDEMVGDQPIPYAPPSTKPTNDTEVLKVQRTPDGNLSLVHNEDINKSTDEHGTGSSKENSESRLQTKFSDGRPLNSTRILESTTHNSAKEPDRVVQSQKITTNDCLEADVVKSNKSFCTHPRNYPKKDHLEDIIKTKFPNLQSFFGEDFVLPQNITQRMSNAPNEEYLCRSRIRVIYPKSAQNRDWNWIYIVNSPQYKQGIRVEECIRPNSECGENTGLSLPSRFTATCEQSYIYRSLIAYYNDTVFKDTFRIPSCCKCVLRSY